MNRGDLLIGGAAAVLGAAVFLYSLSFPHMADGQPGPALFPQLLSLMLIGFGAVTIRQSRNPQIRDEVVHEGTGVVRGAIILFLIGVYIVVVQQLGFVITSALLTVTLMVMLRVRPLTAVLSTAAIIIFSVLLFQKMLRVPLPPGILGF